MTLKRKKIISIACVTIFILMSAAVFWFVGRPMLEFVSQPEKFRAWVNGHGIWGRVAFSAMMAMQIIIAIIPGEPLEIGAGYAFGIFEGTALCLIGVLIGSIVVFYFVRYFGVKAVEVFYPREKIQSLKIMQNQKKLNTLTFILFLIPGTPKDLMTYVIGLTTMRLSTWILITGIARIPSIITSTVGGDALGVQNYQFAILVFAVTIIVSIIGLLVYRVITVRGAAKEGGKSYGND